MPILLRECRGGGNLGNGSLESLKNIGMGEHNRVSGKVVESVSDKFLIGGRDGHGDAVNIAG